MVQRAFTIRRHWMLVQLNILFALLILCMASDAHCAPKVLTLHAGEESYVLNRYLGYVEDKEDQFTFNDFVGEKSNQGFKYIFNATPNFGFTKSTYWFRFDLNNIDSSIHDWYLECQFPVLDQVDVYLIAPGKKIISYKSGDTLPFSQRAIKHRNMIFNVPLAQGEKMTVLVRVKSESSFQVPLRLWSPRAWSAKDHEEQYVLGAYYGILVAMFCYNLLIYLSIKDKNFLYYLHYIGGWLLFQLSLNGLAFEYLWPENPWWGNRANLFFVGFSLIGVMQFTRAFLQLKIHLPWFDLICRVYAFLGAFIVISSLVSSYSFAVMVCNLATMTGASMIFIAGAISLKQNIRQARYFMLAWAVLLIGSIAYALKQFAILPNVFITEYGMQVGSSLEVVLLSFALAHRMRILKDENERIQREARETLELRVQQRTYDLAYALNNLSDANEKLKEMSHIDGLTGVKNRAYFDEKLDSEWRRALREQNFISLLMIDIDFFKQINDQYGHLGGDACLKQVAQVIATAIHRPTDEIFRYGGEEFVVLLPGTDIKASSDIAEKIRSLIETSTITFNTSVIPVAISIGVSSMIPDHASDCLSLLVHADAALYEAKRHGRNQVRIFNAN